MGNAARTIIIFIIILIIVVNIAFCVEYVTIIESKKV